MKYEAEITQEKERQELFVLTINGYNENFRKPWMSKVVDFKRTDNMEEIRRYQTVEELRNDISREKSWRIRERLMGFAALGVTVSDGVISVYSGTPFFISGALVLPGIFLGLYIWSHADDGLAKFGSALKAFEETPFRVGGPLTEKTQATDQIEQTPAQA